MLVEKWMLQAGNCLLKNGRRRTSIAFYNLEMVIRHKNRMKAEALLCRNVVGMLFNFIGNTVIHSCVKVELSYEIKNAPRGCAARGKENIALRTARARRISQARFISLGYFPVTEVQKRCVLYTAGGVSCRDDNEKRNHGT